MRLTLHILAPTLAIYRLPADSAVPPWATTGAFFSITRTTDELSVVCEQQVIAGMRAEADWRGFKVQGPLAFTLTGVVAALTAPLAAAELSVFVLSTFDTDYLLVKATDLPRATEVLIGAGHEVVA